MQSFIALGGNRGEVAETFQAALRQLGAIPGIEVRAVSSFQRTPAVGSTADSDYLNAAAELHTDCSALELLDHLQTVELQHGRVRSTHWGPRTLDLDLLLHGSEVIVHPRLKVPHPGCWYRRFVLDPLTEIAATFVHPVKQVTIQQLRERLLPRPITVDLAGGSSELRDRLAAEISSEFCEVQLQSTTAKRQPTLWLWLGSSPEKTTEFEQLPIVPRLDLTVFPENPNVAARHVLQAALG